MSGALQLAGGGGDWCYGGVASSLRARNCIVPWNDRVCDFACRLVIFTDAVDRYSSVFSSHLAPPTNESTRCGDRFCGDSSSGIVIESFNYNNILDQESIGSHRPILTRFFVYREYLKLHGECQGVLITDSRSRLPRIRFLSSSACLN